MLRRESVSPHPINLGRRAPPLISKMTEIKICITPTEVRLFEEEAIVFWHILYLLFDVVCCIECWKQIVQV